MVFVMKDCWTWHETIRFSHLAEKNYIQVYRQKQLGFVLVW